MPLFEAGCEALKSSIRSVELFQFGSPVDLVSIFRDAPIGEHDSQGIKFASKVRDLRSQFHSHLFIGHARQHTKFHLGGQAMIACLMNVPSDAELDSWPFIVEPVSPLGKGVVCIPHRRMMARLEYLAGIYVRERFGTMLVIPPFPESSTPNQ